MTPFLLFFFFAFSFASAEEPDYRSYFKHPDVKLRIRIGTARSEAVPFKNHFVPTSPGQKPGFKLGFGTSGERPDDPSVDWEFIRKTDYGDLYLFAIKKRGSLIKAIPALYTGSPISAYEHNDVAITFEPESPASK